MNNYIHSERFRNVSFNVNESIMTTRILYDHLKRSLYGSCEPICFYRIYRVITGFISSKAIRVYLTRNAWKARAKEDENFFLLCHSSFAVWLVNGGLIWDRISRKIRVLSQKIIKDIFFSFFSLFFYESNLHKYSIFRRDTTRPSNTVLLVVKFWKKSQPPCKSTNRPARLTSSRLFRPAAKSPRRIIKISAWIAQARD